MSVILLNARQYRLTKSKLAQMEASLEETRRALEERSDLPDEIKTAQVNGIAFTIEDLRAQLAEYETLAEGKPRTVELKDVLSELPTTLIRARINGGWSQADLAEELGVSQQQVQKDEAGAYAKASLDKLLRVADALRLSISGVATLAPKIREVPPRPLEDQS